MTYIEEIRSEYCSKIRARILDTLTGEDGRFMYSDFSEAVREAVSLRMLTEEDGETLRVGIKQLYRSEDRIAVIIHLASILNNEGIRQFIGTELSDMDIGVYLKVASSYSRRERLGLAH